MGSRFIAVILILISFAASAADAPKPDAPKPATPVDPTKAEVKSVLTEDDFASMAAMTKKAVAAMKIGDRGTADSIAGQIVVMARKLSSDPESWSEQEATERLTSWRRFITLTKDIKEGSTPNIHYYGEFYYKTGDYVADAQDVQIFIKRWKFQATALSDTVAGTTIDGEAIRRKEMLAFMNDHMKLYPDAASRVTLLTQLAAVGVRSKALKELQAELSDTPVPPDDPKDKNKRKPKQ